MPMRMLAVGLAAAALVGAEARAQARDAQPAAETLRSAHLEQPPADRQDPSDPVAELLGPVVEPRARAPAEPRSGRERPAPQPATDRAAAIDDPSLFFE